MPRKVPQESPLMRSNLYQPIDIQDESQVSVVEPLENLNAELTNLCPSHDRELDVGQPYRAGCTLNPTQMDDPILAKELQNPIIKAKPINNEERFAHITIAHDDWDRTCATLFMYDKHPRAEKMQLWAALRNISNTVQGQWVVCVSFNTAASTSECIGHRCPE
ncbi:hypothetical protein ACH5RR_026132 [Cinchona calisaya]|uniref:Uncharacterized protein n=1 Tax=Cinchona calisaya TaxID=153742 RepID=A0ABD2Z508_9GENT